MDAYPVAVIRDSDLPIGTPSVVFGMVWLRGTSLFPLDFSLVLTWSGLYSVADVIGSSDGK
jgi:hypothetical protein